MIFSLWNPQARRINAYFTASYISIFGTIWTTLKAKKSDNRGSAMWKLFKKLQLLLGNCVSVIRSDVKVVLLTFVAKDKNSAHAQVDVFLEIKQRTAEPTEDSRVVTETKLCEISELWWRGGHWAANTKKGIKISRWTDGRREQNKPCHPDYKTGWIIHRLASRCTVIWLR